MKQGEDFFFLPTTARFLYRLTAWIVLAIGGLALVGWAFDITLLKSIRAGWNSMKVVTAICLMMLAAAFMWLRAGDPWKRALCRFFCILVCATAAGSLMVYGVVLSTGHDPGWVSAPFFSLFLGPTDRMAVPTALIFLGLGCSLLLLHTGRRGMADAAHALVLPVAVMSYLVLAGYIFSAPSVHAWLGVPVALHTGVALCLLCLGILSARTDTWLMSSLTSPEAGGQMARRLLPLLLLLPLVIGFLRVRGERADIFESEVGVALVAAIYAVSFLFLIWWSARSGNRLQRKTERALREARDRLDLQVRERTAELSRTALYARNLIETSLDPLVTISPDGKITDVNEATINVTGVSRGQLVGTDFSDYFTEPSRAREGYEQVFAKGLVTDYPLTIRHASGRTTDVLYNATIYRSEAGEVQGVFAAARDVTESKKVMRAFIETKNFLDNILESSTRYSIIGKDLNNRILSWNEGAHRNYGYAAQEIIGRDSGILHTPEDIKSGAVDEMMKVAHENGVAEGEFLRVRKDGSRFVATVVVTRRNDASGHPIGYLVISNDISEKKLTEQRLWQASLYARSLIEASLDPLVTISADGKITDVNEATINVTGVSRGQLVGTDFSDYFTEPSRAR
ncbi:MAG: PAS domain S-box protein [Deltaproteobacteria bacterium]|nr:PAS domain S-box protein [Deltaproteobacteria bacterium]